ncbi:phage major capsid protein [Anaerotignum sp. MB30-C6]|uniref:phage major capsid protein n=1 Tax=Anaerotignum sp. MB30-C6 TaxID=3070814 RepID=UPI0027DBE83D|nr:phage major capsid protein [Anaerotignum sp. MB30-C6]WMI82090.1 phage major capsid protein [Anaerotignum sp. MB30-C6]
MANMQILAAQKRMKEKALADLEARGLSFLSKRKELEERAEKVETEQDLNTIVAETDENDGNIRENEEQQEALRTEIAGIDTQMADFEKRLGQAFKETKKRGGNMTEEMEEKRAAINGYIRKRAVAGITSTTAEVTIPAEILYNPQDELKTLLDLSKYVTIANVTAASGKYPVRKRANATLASVIELETNPKLADPSFNEVPWEIETFRGAIAISQEAIDDSAIDLIPLVAKDAAEQKLNTVNGKISAVLKTFTPLTVTGVDGIKEIVNKKLDRAYERMIIASASFYHAVDTLKDKDGRYLLQQDIKSPTGHVFLGMPIEIVNDTDLGAEGDAKAFIGDVKRGVFMANRKDLEVKWVDHHIYGEYLRAGIRFGITKADANAGYLVTYTPPVGE